MRAYEGHKRYHAEMWDRLSRHFDCYTENEKKTILNFLEEYLKGMNSLQE